MVHVYLKNTKVIFSVLREYVFEGQNDFGGCLHRLRKLS